MIRVHKLNVHTIITGCTTIQSQARANMFVVGQAQKDPHKEREKRVPVW